MEQPKNNQGTALLIMDVQEAIAKMLKDGDPFFDAITKAVRAARNNNIPVVYIIVAFREGYPEVSRHNKAFSILKNANRNLDKEEGYRIHDSVAPEPGDIIIKKKRVSAFTGSDLEVVLRSLGITHIVLSGISTSGVVLSTLREAADRDFRISVLADCCADQDEEVHRVLTAKVFPKQAEVVGVEKWLD